MHFPMHISLPSPLHPERSIPELRSPTRSLSPPRSLPSIAFPRFANSDRWFLGIDLHCIRAQFAKHLSFLIPPHPEQARPPVAFPPSFLGIALQVKCKANAEPSSLELC
ncbi:MAG: hypothetical protein IKQ03_13515 [Prevotella sp.]|nr:hypothetical protein [Prevotella sp.]